MVHPHPITVLRTRNDIVSSVYKWRLAGDRIAFVPTMGYLHEGHLALVRQAKSLGNRVVVSIFVNPKQFNVPADLAAYPRDEERDLALLQELGVDVVFCPSPEEIYRPGHSTYVSANARAEGFEGTGRPGHFQGVTTVVAILFHLVAPHAALFGEKDFQQLRVIEQMVEDLGFNVQIVRAPLVREPDGLALSSRNVRLSPEGRALALSLSKSLFAALKCFRAGERGGAAIRASALSVLHAHPEVQIEYLSLVDEETLQEVERVQEEGCRLLLTATVEGVRLLDNIPLRLLE